MLPSSDELEALVARASKVSTALGKLGKSQSIPASTKTEVTEVAREWLRVSSAIREEGICDAAKLGAYDASMEAILASHNSQPRASALRAKLKGFLGTASSDVVVPLIRHAGSPRQVLARQIVAAFKGTLSAEETAYVDEAARCVTVTAYRAAIIMLWAAGIARFHSAIDARGFNAYTQAVDNTITKKKGAPVQHREG